MMIQQLSSKKTCALLAKAMIIQNLREKEFQCILIVLLCLILGVIAAPALLRAENLASKELFLRFGISFIIFCAQFYTLLIAARQFPNEKEHSTILPLMSKPVSRSEYIVGKWFGAFALGAIVLTGLELFWLICVPLILHITIDSYLLVQMFAFNLLSMAAVASLGIFGSMFMPTALNLGSMALLIFFGDKVGNYLTHFLNQFLPTGVTAWLINYIPRFDYFDLSGLCSSMGLPINPLPSAAICLYALLWTVLPLVLATFIFRKKAL